MSRLTIKNENVDFLTGVKFEYETDNLYAVDKLGKLEDLEEELGIDLITLFKALKDGIYFFENDFETNNKEVNFTKRPRLYYSVDFNCLCFEILLGAWKVKLKDYGKTWALSRNDLEEQDDE